MSFFKKTLPLVLLGTLATASAREVEIQFLDQPTLRGELKSISKNQILFQHADYKKPVRFNTDKLKSIKLSNAQKVAKGAEPVGKIQIVPRGEESIPNDIIKGDLTSVEGGNIAIKTAYAGKLLINKEFVQSLDIFTPEHLVLQGPGLLSDWQILKGSKGIVQAGDSLIFKRIQNTNSLRFIHRKIDYPESFEVELVTNGAIYNKRFTIDLFSNEDGRPYGKKGSLSVMFSGSSITVTRISAKNRSTTIARASLTPKQRRLSGKLKFHYFFNQKTKKFSAYLNGEAVLNEVLVEDTENLGSHLSLNIRSYSQDIEIEKLNLKKWSGHIPSSIDPNSAEFKDEKGELIKLHNGDILFGTLKKIDKGVAFIKTQYGNYKVKLAYITNIDIGNKEENQVRMNIGDVRLRFSDGSHFIVQMKSIKDGKLIGTSQTFQGEQSFDIKMIESIEFENSLYRKNL